MRKIQSYQRSIFWGVDEVVGLIRKPEVAETLINQSLDYTKIRSNRCVEISQETATRFQNVLYSVVEVMEGYNRAGTIPDLLQDDVGKTKFVKVAEDITDNLTTSKRSEF